MTGRLSIRRLTYTFGADALDDVFDVVDLESRRDIDNRNLDVVDAKCAVAASTGKMDVVNMLFTMTATDAIFANTSTVFYLMKKMLFCHQTKCAEDA